MKTAQSERDVVQAKNLALEEELSNMEGKIQVQEQLATLLAKKEESIGLLKREIEDMKRYIEEETSNAAKRHEANESIAKSAKEISELKKMNANLGHEKNRILFILTCDDQTD